MIVVEQVEFAYGNLPVLRGVDLRIRPGEVVFLLGPNGVGKTTLVELLLGFLSPDSGTVRVLGVDPGKADAGFWGRIGLVQQGWSDHTRWRVCDQLEWVRAIQATSGRSGSTVAEVLRMVGLEGKAKVRLGRLSGGQRRTIDLVAWRLNSFMVWWDNEAWRTNQPRPCRFVMVTKRYLRRWCVQAPQPQGQRSGRGSCCWPPRESRMR